jgi:hypothetical protein
MDMVGLHVPTKQIRDFSTCSVGNFTRLGPSTRYVTAAKTSENLDVFNKHNISLENTFSFA